MLDGFITRSHANRYGGSIKIIQCWSKYCLVVIWTVSHLPSWGNCYLDRQPNYFWKNLRVCTANQCISENNAHIWTVCQSIPGRSRLHMDNQSIHFLLTPESSPLQIKDSRIKNSRPSIQNQGSKCKGPLQTWTNGTSLMASLYTHPRWKAFLKLGRGRRNIYFSFGKNTPMHQIPR